MSKHYTLPTVFNSLITGTTASIAIAKKVHELRVSKGKGHSLRAVAARLGNLNHSIIDGIEKNRRDLTLLESIALCKALDVDPQVLFDVAVEQVNQLMDTEYHGK